MTLFPPWGDLPTYATVAQALTFFHVEDDAWNAFMNQVGNVGEDLTVSQCCRMDLRSMWD